MIEVFDDALEPHVAELIDMQLRDVSWKYNYDSVKNGKNKQTKRRGGSNTLFVGGVLPGDGPI